MGENVATMGFDVASQLEEVAKDFVQFVEKEFPEFISDIEEKVNDNIILLLNVEKPKIMVYGIYNGGKSTLINTLCKAEVAKVGDKPMTDHISEYDRGDYFLVDSPGINAPKEHELVTEAYLNKCHVILFVISSKGMFEDRENYKRLAKLIESDVPFIIVLNDRGYSSGMGWSKEKKKQAKFQHEQDLNRIQCKIIENLMKESKNPNIANQYEVVILNAKQAWTGLSIKKPQLYETSGVEQLNKRILQLLSNDVSIASLFKRPIANMKEYLNEVEKMITRNVNGEFGDDFETRLDTLATMKDNIMHNIQIRTRQAVKEKVEALSKSYLNGDVDAFEIIANDIYDIVDDCYISEVNRLFKYVDRNFNELGIADFDTTSNFWVDTEKMAASELPTEHDNKQDAPMTVSREKQHWYDYLKTRKRLERERKEYLEKEARQKNEYAQYQLQENIRKRQEARQLADGSLNELYNEYISALTKSFDEKYDDIINKIQMVSDMNQKMKEDCDRQMAYLRELRRRIVTVENSLNMVNA